MPGKRGRDSIQSKSTRRFSDDSFENYYKNQGSSPMRKLTKKEAEAISRGEFSATWVKHNLAQNKQYEKVNKLGGKNQGWEDVYRKANDMGIDTSLLETRARRSNDSFTLNEYGFKPHVQNVISQVERLKKEGLMPGANIKGISTTFSKPSVYGSYSPDTGRYVINMNALGVGRMAYTLKNGTLAGKDFSSVAIHELGHSVYFQNAVKRKTGKTKSGKRVGVYTTYEKQVRQAYANLHKGLRKTTKIKGQSSYVDKIVQGRTKSSTYGQRKKARKITNVEGFSEGYVNYVNYRRGYGELSPSGRVVGDFISSINKARKSR